MSNSSVPFILRNSVHLATSSDWHDEYTSDDPLPAPLDTNESGITFIRATRLTEVSSETTDDQ